MQYNMPPLRFTIARFFLDVRICEVAAERRARLPKNKYKNDCIYGIYTCRHRHTPKIRAKIMATVSYRGMK